MMTNLGPAQLTRDHAASSHGLPVLVLSLSAQARGTAETADLILLTASRLQYAQLVAAGYHLRLTPHLQRQIAD